MEVRWWKWGDGINNLLLIRLDDSAIKLAIKWELKVTICYKDSGSNAKPTNRVCEQFADYVMICLEEIQSIDLCGNFQISKPANIVDVLV